MPHFTMDCYYRASRGGEPILREKVVIRAPGRSIAIEEALRRAEFLRPNYFEVRDPAQFDDLLYNSLTDGGPPHASHAPRSAFSLAGEAIPVTVASPTLDAPTLSDAGVRESPTPFKTLDEFQRWFDSQMKAHKRTPYPLLRAAMKKKAAKRKNLPGPTVGGASPLSPGSDRTARQSRSRTRNSRRNGRASA
ncbi:MAG TPA: hypothetical protein VGF33_09315 [Caulobacteraceae bacterium]